MATFGIGYNYELDWYWDTVWNQHCGRKDNGCGYTGDNAYSDTNNEDAK